MSYPLRLSIFIVVCCAVGVVFLFLFFYPPLKRFLYRNMTVKMYFKKVNRMVLDNDYLLINNFKNKTADQEDFHIDHIVIGDKFFYCIRDRYYSGALSADPSEKYWTYYSGRKKISIDNPMLINKVRVDRLSLISGIDPKFFISIVLVNDDCLLSLADNPFEDNFIVSLKNLPKLIKEIESTDVDPLDPKAIEVVAKDFDELNQTKD